MDGLRQLFRFFDMDIKNLPTEVTRKTTTVKDYVPSVSEYRDMFNCGNILDRTIISMALDLGWRIGDFVKVKKDMLPNLDKEAPLAFDFHFFLFDSPQGLFDFSTATLVNDSDPDYNPAEVLRDFVAHCRERKLPVAKTLRQIISLEDFQKELSIGETTSLSSYIKFILECFLIEQTEKNREKKLQEKFRDMLTNFQCSCGQNIVSMLIMVGSDDGSFKLLCTCGSKYRISCVKCDTTLRWDSKRASYSCSGCKMIFPRPQIKANQLNG